MASPIINDLVLPRGTILVRPDSPDASIGIITHRSIEGGGHFKGSANPLIESNHILYVKEMVAEVVINDIDYLSMYEGAVVGIIPE